MKPTKNSHFCLACRRKKMLFDDKAKADNFIKYNKEEILEENDKAPVRSYFCITCGGWHVTSIESSVTGERINERDAKVLERQEQFKNELNELRSYIQTKVKKANFSILTGKLDEAEDLLEICQMEIEKADKKIVGNLKFSKVISMLASTKYRFKVAKYLYDKTDTELENIMQSEKNDKQDKDIATTARGLYLSRKFYSLLDNIKNGVNVEESRTEYLKLLEANLNVKTSTRKKYFHDLLYSLDDHSKTKEE